MFFSRTNDVSTSNGHQQPVLKSPIVPPALCGTFAKKYCLLQYVLRF